MSDFVYLGSPVRVLFGNGRVADLPQELARLGCRRPLILSTPEQHAAAAALADSLGPESRVFAGAVMHTPTDVTATALGHVATGVGDCLIAFGGGSAIGLSKALAVRTGLPQIAIPTTYAGSEVTDILGETEAGVKITRRGPEILPEVVIYDVRHTFSLSPLMSAASGLNAVAHAVEALYAHDGNPVVSLMAEAGIAAMVRGLPRIVRDPHDVAAREDAQYGAWLSGMCLGAVSMALHHKLAHVLGGAFNLPHAETHAVLLPYSLAFNASAVPGAVARIAAAMGERDPVGRLHAMLAELGLPTSLAAIGMPPDGVAAAAELTLANRYANPRALEREPLRALLEAALNGAPPETTA